MAIHHGVPDRRPLIPGSRPATDASLDTGVDTSPGRIRDQITLRRQLEDFLHFLPVPHLPVRARSYRNVCSRAKSLKNINVAIVKYISMWPSQEWISSKNFHVNDPNQVVVCASLFL